MDTDLNNQEVQNEVAQESQAVAEQPEAAASPTDLAAAFEMLRANDNGTTPSIVANGEGEAGSPGGNQDNVPVAESTVSEQQPGESGTTPIDLSGFNPNTYGQDVLKNIRNQVIQEKSKEWSEKGYKTFKVRDLARRDEQTGRIFYVNPNDNPKDWERPGYQGLTLEQAKTWCDVTNQDLNDQWRQECKELEQQYIEDAMPTLRLAAFAPVYQGMSQVEKDVVDEMTAPYAIIDANGRITGYNCDLNSVANIARSVAKRIGSASPAPAPVNNVRQPATDARSSAGGSSKKGLREPKDLSEAMEILWEMDR